MRPLLRIFFSISFLRLLFLALIVDSVIAVERNIDVVSVSGKELFETLAVRCPFGRCAYGLKKIFF
jgi:hypothetical protein